MAKEQQESVIQLLITLLAVIIESFFSLILRFDDKLKQAAYPLAKNNAVVVVRSYLPHEEIFLTFSFKGILIDSDMPKHKDHADIIINAHSFEIINAIISDKQQAIDKLQYRGNEEDIEHLKNFLLVLSINGFMELLLSRFNKKQNTQLNDTKPNKDKVANSKQKIATLKTELNTAKINNTRLNTQVAEFQSKDKSQLPLAMLTLVIGLCIGRFLL